MAKVFQPSRSTNPKHIAHPLLHYVLCNTKLTRDVVALALKKTRKALYDWEYQLTAYKSFMLDEVAKAADFDINKIPPHIYARALAADDARLAADDKKVRARKKKVEDATQTAASNPDTPTAPKAATSKPVKARPPNPVQEAKKTMLRYEVRFIPSHGDIVNGRDARRADGWYTLLPIGNLEHMDYSKTKEESLKKAEARRAQDNADIAEFL